MRFLPRLLPVLVAAAAVAACGDSDGSTLRSAGELPAAQEATTTTAATTTTTTTTTTAATTTTTTTTTATTTSLPGEVFDPVFTPAGTILDAIGVAYDETFDLRSLPGSGQPVVASLPPLSGGIESQGRARLIQGDGIWLEVGAIGRTGWGDLSQLARLGGIRDVTTDVLAAVGATPTAPTMLELGQTVTEVVVPSDPAAPPAEVIVAAAPSPTATAEIVYDVFPGEFLGDDTSIGFRVVVVGRQVVAGSLPDTGFASATAYELARVDAITFCTRGVTSDGLCV